MTTYSNWSATLLGEGESERRRRRVRPLWHTRPAPAASGSCRNGGPIDRLRRIWPRGPDNAGHGEANGEECPTTQIARLATAPPPATLRRASGVWYADSPRKATINEPQRQRPRSGILRAILSRSGPAHRPQRCRTCPQVSPDRLGLAQRNATVTVPAVPVSEPAASAAEVDWRGTMNRRDFLFHSGGGLGGIALAAMLGRTVCCAERRVAPQAEGQARRATVHGRRRVATSISSTSSRNS